MEKIIIEGESRLSGRLRVQGAKNSVLPILAASILTGGQTVLSNCPHLKDVSSALMIMEHLGCRVKHSGGDIFVDASDIKSHEVPWNLMREMRSSVIFLGAILGRCGSALMSYPGGCELGPRPIDLHVSALRRLGAVISDDAGSLCCNTGGGLKGAEIHLPLPSVGATENVMLAAATAHGTTVLKNAAREPEIVDLQSFLNAMGSKVMGAGSSTVVIEGVTELSGCEYSVMPDRIVAATYLAAAAATGGDIEIYGACPPHLDAITALFEEMGCEISSTEDSIRLKCKSRLKPVRTIRTMPYPGFPTDAQSIMMSCLSTASGTSVIVETIFQNRFRNVEALCRMGADIFVNGQTAVVTGVSTLRGANVACTDLRGGAALCVAALGARGISEITELEHIDRGYEYFEKNLSLLGANIQRI